MAYEFLQKLFGKNEDGSDKALTFPELETLLNADGAPKIVDLSSGGYVDKQKHDRISSELSGVKAQLTDANKQIQAFKDMDIDGIKAAADKYKEDSEAAIKSLNDQLAAKEARYNADKFLNGYEFSSSFARDAVLDKFLAKNFQLGDDGKYLGADDFMKGLQESNPDAFKAAAPADPNPAPQFAPGGAATPPGGSGRKMSLDEVMAYANANPKANIDELLDSNFTF